jgi:hypothetical protein
MGFLGVFRATVITSAPRLAEASTSGKVEHVPTAIYKIISGAQAGADRAALDFAIEHGIPHGGWCPKGRRSEDGGIPAKYQLQETPSNDYPQRTEWNVRDSDGTVVFSLAPMISGGSKKTITLATRLRKPVIHISRDRDGDRAPQLLQGFIREHRIQVLNCAGPRASKEPEVGEFVIQTLTGAIAPKQTGVVADPRGCIQA